MPERSERQAFAAKLGFSETVFVDDPERGIIDIYTPTLRLPFAGHPCVGTAWLLDVPELVTPAGLVGARLDGEFSWIEARAEWAPDADAAAVRRRPRRSTRWRCRRRGSGSTRGPGRTRRPGGCGPVRFPGADDGIDEDEATGAAALLLTRPAGPGAQHHAGQGVADTHGAAADGVGGGRRTGVPGALSPAPGPLTGSLSARPASGRSPTAAGQPRRVTRTGRTLHPGPGRRPCSARTPACTPSTIRCFSSSSAAAPARPAARGSRA